MSWHKIMQQSKTEWIFIHFDDNENVFQSHSGIAFLDFFQEKALHFLWKYCILILEVNKFGTGYAEHLLDSIKVTLLKLFFRGPAGFISPLSLKEKSEANKVVKGYHKDLRRFHHGICNFKWMYCVWSLRAGVPSWSNFGRRYLFHWCGQMHRLRRLRRSLPGRCTGTESVIFGSKSRMKNQTKSRCQIASAFCFDKQFHTAKSLFMKYIKRTVKNTESRFFTVPALSLGVY